MEEWADQVRKLTDEACKAKISALGVEEQRVNVLLDFTERNGDTAAIADGFRVIVHVVIWQHADVLRIPITAMFRRGNGWAVFVVRSGRARMTSIEVGMANDDVTQVLKGLSPADLVILIPVTAWPTAHPSLRRATLRRRKYPEARI